MKFLAAYNNLFFYIPSSVKKTIVFLLFCFIAFNKLTAQDTLKLQFLKDSSYHYSSFILKQPVNLNPLSTPKKATFLAGQKIIFTPDTASFNERYKPANNPLLLWKYDYPLTAEQMNERDEHTRRENNATNQVIKTILSGRKKNQKAVSPKF